MSKISIEVFNAKSPSSSAVIVEEVGPNDTVLSIKKKFSSKKHLGVERIALRLDPRGKGLRDEDTVSSLNLPSNNAQLYYRDLGPQIAWKTVFLMEYAGPLCVYPLFYLRPWFIYGAGASSQPVSHFVHRFSNGTMPITNLFKNCTYYWGFAAFVSYFVNHPYYSIPTFGSAQIYLGLAGFLISELGNYSIHILLRDLRPAGSKERKVPYPNSNPLTQLYNLVSCPNYTYEVAAWTSFTLMTQCLPAAMFTLLGFAQMKVWANGKHRAYKKDFPNYPKNRTPIIPFVC